MSDITFALPFISADLATSAQATGVSESTIREAIAAGALVPRYVGRRASKPVLLATELFAWAESLPTERGRA